MIARKTYQRIRSFAHAIELIDKRSLTCTKRKVSNKLTLIRSKSEGSKVWDRVEVMCRGCTMATITPDDIAMVKFNCYTVANDYSEAFGLCLMMRGGTGYVVPSGMSFNYRATPTERALWPHRAPLMPLDLKSNLFLKYETDPRIIVDVEKARAWRAHVSQVFAQFRVHAALDLHKNIDRRKPNADGQDDRQLDWTSAALYKAIRDSDMHKLMLFALHHGMHFQGCNVSSKQLVQLLTSRYNNQRDAIRLRAGAIALEQVNNGS